MLQASTIRMRMRKSPCRFQAPCRKVRQLCSPASLLFMQSSLAVALITVEWTLQRDRSLYVCCTGSGTLKIDFVGELNDKMKGFYRSKYTTSAGEIRYAAVTQFEVKWRGVGCLSFGNVWLMLTHFSFYGATKTFCRCLESWGSDIVRNSWPFLNAHFVVKGCYTE